MREFTKPLVVVSKCIEFEPVRWDGRIIASEFVKKLKSQVEFIAVCPELEIGLGVPRNPIRIVRKGEGLRLIQPATGLDFTDKMQQFARSFLDALPEVDGFILKSGSPSSAMKDAKFYPSIERVSPLGKVPGFFGGMAVDRFGFLAVEDEHRLLNPRIKEHFLTKLYTLSDFRSVKNSGSIKRLIDFQSRNKLLFTAYSQVELHDMGRIVAQPKGIPFQKIIIEYQNHLWNALKRPPRRGANENVLTKAAGYFNHKLTKNEKTFFLDTVSKYKAGKLPLSTPLNILKSWIIRFNEEYLLQQTFFEPYPDALMEQENAIPNIDDKDYWKT